MNNTMSASSAKPKHGGLFRICAGLWEQYPAAVLFTIAFFCSLALIWLNPIPADDTMTRYAPMAEAFAKGNWSLAFHPRYGMLFTTISGLLCTCIPGLDGFRACQIAALLLWSLSVFPLYALFRTTFSKKISITAATLYLLCSHLHRYVYDGLRDNGKTLGFTLLLCGLLQFYRNRKSEVAWITAGLGAAVLSMLRADGFAISGCLLFVFWIFDLQANKWKFRRTVCAGLMLLLLLTPQIILTYRWTGIPAPNSAYAFLLRDRLHLVANLEDTKDNTIQEEANAERSE